MKIKTLPLKDLKAKKPAELEKYIAELKSAQAEFNHGLYTGKEKQTHQVSVLKRAIAQAKTIQTAVRKEEK